MSTKLSFKINPEYALLLVIALPLWLRHGRLMRSLIRLTTA
jgi:hypothetical protein